MSGLASVTDAQRQGLVFLDPDHISSVHEISGRTEITLTVLSFAVAVALLTTIIMGLANICDALRKKLVRGSGEVQAKCESAALDPSDLLT
jgi:hypothetical protein